MSRCIWRGEWYVYNHLRREFMQHVTRMGSRDKNRPDAPRVQWTPMAKRAKAYKNPSAAQKTAARINADLYRTGNPCFPCQPVSVVTGEAARCLDMINKRPHPSALRAATFPKGEGKQE